MGRFLSSWSHRGRSKSQYANLGLQGNLYTMTNSKDIFWRIECTNEIFSLTVFGQQED